MSVTLISVHQVISGKPFIHPTARPTGPVRLPADLVDEEGSDIKHVKKKSHKSKSKHKSDKSESHRHSDQSSDIFTWAGDFLKITGSAPAGTQDIPGPGIKSVPPPQPGVSDCFCLCHWSVFPRDSGYWSFSTTHKASFLFPVIYPQVYWTGEFIELRLIWRIVNNVDILNWNRVNCRIVGKDMKLQKICSTGRLSGQ